MFTRQDIEIPREINKAIFKSESTETTNRHQFDSDTPIESAHNSTAFSIAAPIEWNNLDIYLRTCESTSSFNTLIKTHLFIVDYYL